MKATKKLALVIPSLDIGGMERVMAELANYFANKKYIEVHLVLYGLTRRISYALPSNITIHKPSFEFDNAKRAISTIRTILFLRKTINRLKPDTILSFGEYWNSFVMLALIGKRVPVFLSDRCQPDKHLGKLHEFLRSWLYPKAAGIISQTTFAKNIYQQKKLNSNITVIGNPIRTIGENNSVDKENIVLTVGRLIRTKHHDELIKLFLDINNDGWKLVIVGDDALKEKNMQRLQQMVEERKANDKVILTGKKLDVDSYYVKSKIFAFTSSSEGFPNVIGEAQSSGLPVIAFDCNAGPSDLIDNGKNGFLVPLFDYALFKQKLETLMVNEDLIDSMGQTGKQSIKRFSIEAVGNSFENFIFSA